MVTPGIVFPPVIIPEVSKGYQGAKRIFFEELIILAGKNPRQIPPVADKEVLLNGGGVIVDEGVEKSIGVKGNAQNYQQANEGEIFCGQILNLYF